MKKTINQPCPHCHEQIHFEWTPDHDWTPLNDAWHASLISRLKCSPCVDLEKRLSRCREAIGNLNDKIRQSDGDAVALDALTGALQAQYSSRRLLQKKLDERAGITRQKPEVDKTQAQRLPW